MKYRNEHDLTRWQLGEPHLTSKYCLTEVKIFKSSLAVAQNSTATPSKQIVSCRTPSLHYSESSAWLWKAMHQWKLQNHLPLSWTRQCGFEDLDVEVSKPLGRCYPMTLMTATFAMHSIATLVLCYCLVTVLVKQLIILLVSPHTCATHEMS